MRSTSPNADAGTFAGLIVAAVPGTAQSAPSRRFLLAPRSTSPI